MAVNTFEDEALAMQEIEKILLHMKLAGLSDEKAGTHGGERTSPCPLCKIKNGYGGTKRCQWWPARPYFGRGSKDDPMFWCRDCGESGDLVKMYCRVYKVSFAEGCAHFGIKEYKHRTSGRVVTLDDPHVTVQKKPHELWLGRAWQLVDEGCDLLFTPEGEDVLLHLMMERGLTEEAIRYLKIGYQPDNRRWDAPELWGLDGKKLRIHKGIILPEMHVNPETGELDIYSIEIRRSEMDMFDEEFETGREQHKYNFVRGGQRGLYCVGVKRALPASLNEGKFNAIIAWQEGRDEFGGIATQSKDGALDNIATVMAALNKPSVIELNHEADEGGRTAAEMWGEYLDNSIIHHPPNKFDLNEYHVNGKSVYDFLAYGLERYERQKSRYNAIFGASPSNVVQFPVNTQQEPAKTITESSSDVPEANTELIKDDEFAHLHALMRPAVPRTVLSQEETDAFLNAIEILASRQNKAETPLPEEEGQSHQEEIKEPPTAITAPCLRCGGQGEYIDPDGNTWCRQDVASYRLMRDGADRRVMYGNLYLGEETSITMPLFGVDGIAMIQELPCEHTEIPGGRSNWLKFATKAAIGDVWKAAMEAHQVLCGFEPRQRPVARQADQVKLRCARAQCKHDAGKSWRQNQDKIRDEKGNETNKFKWPLYYPHEVSLGYNMVGDEEKYTFCPRCLTASYLLELVQSLGWRRYSSYKGQVSGREAWTAYCLEESDFEIAVAFDAMRRQYSAQWLKVQDKIVH